MAIFEIEANGKTFEVDAPDAKTAASAFASMSEPVSTAKDMAKSGVAGVGKGFVGLAGLPGDLSELGARGIDWATRKVGGALGVDVPTREDRAPTYGSADIKKAVESQTGEFYKPQTTAGKYAETVGEFAPGLIGGGGVGALARRAVTNVVAPGMASEAAGQATEGKAVEPYARVAGALAGGLAPTAIARAVTPLPATAARQRLVDILNDEGVTSLTAGQRTGSPSLRYAESALGDSLGAGGQASRVTREGQEQFTQAALRRTGAAGDNAGPEVLAANNQRLGDQFRDLSARNTLQMDQPFANDIRTVIRDYARVLPTEQRERVYNIITDLAQQGNTIPGEVYQATRSRLSTSANNNRVRDPDYADALRGIRNALDNAMGRSIPAGSADQALWQATRREYGAQKTIEKAASKAGEATAEGQIVPANLRNTVATGNNRGAYARGEGDFSELARAGAGVMGGMPQSGTAPRAAIHAIAAMLGAGTGAVGGAGVGSGIGAAAGAVAGPALAGRALMSRPVQGYLGNQRATQVLQHLNPREAAVVAALLGGRQQLAIGQQSR
jgi:hypothetical protein